MDSVIKCLQMLRRIRNIAIVSLGAIAIIGTLVIFGMNKYYIEFSVADQASYEFEYGSGEKLAPVTAVYKGTIFHREGTPLKVSVTGQESYESLGSYQLIYYAQHKDLKADVTVNITIKDSLAPTLTLVSNPEHYTSPVGSYQEEGFSAIDNYDGDITSRVVKEEKDGKVIYKVTDTAGNEAVAERTIQYKDVIAPVLSLGGKPNQTLYVGGRYTEAGYSAVDECDGDITSKVVVEGGVNTQQAGSYTIVYRVTDSSGNVSEARRNVTVKKPIPATGDKVIYLTFDDGPSAYTQGLLDILDRYGVKATFFVTGGSPKYAHLIGEAHRRGHTIALHTYSHVYSDIYSSVSAYFADLNKIKSLVVSQTGVEPWLIRFPGGTSNTVSRNYCPGIMTALAREVLARGYEYCDWNVESYDSGNSTTEQQVINSVINGISGKNNAIVLQHDMHAFSVNAVDDIIEWGMNNGYVFKAIDRSTPFSRANIRN